MLPNIHLIGIQGSGKGTQSALLVERYNLTYLAAGNMFRERAAVGDEFGKQIAATMHAGQLLPVEYLCHTIEDYLTSHPSHVGILGDGIMRTTEQYEQLETIWKLHGIGEPFLINLVLNEQDALQRIYTRQQDQADLSKRPFHEVYSGKLVKRTDDNPLAIEERFRIFFELTKPVIAKFEAAGNCVHIDARKDIHTIASEITSAVEGRYPQLKQS